MRSRKISTEAGQVNGAMISECGKYRYVLTRAWDFQNTCRCLFIMLNPSTADAYDNDPTVVRCIDYAKRFGCSSLAIVNMFAHRATDSRELSKVEDPVGPLNDMFLEDYIGEADIIIAAWSTGPKGNKELFLQQEQRVKNKLPYSGVYCLELSKDGHPKHPLYLKKNIKLQEFHV